MKTGFMLNVLAESCCIPEMLLRRTGISAPHPPFNLGTLSTGEIHHPAILSAKAVSKGLGPHQQFTFFPLPVKQDFSIALQENSSQKHS